MARHGPGGRDRCRRTIYAVGGAATSGTIAGQRGTVRAQRERVVRRAVAADGAVRVGGSRGHRRTHLRHRRLRTGRLCRAAHHRRGVQSQRGNVDSARPTACLGATTWQPWRGRTAASMPLADSRRPPRPAWTRSRRHGHVGTMMPLLSPLAPWLAAASVPIGVSTRWAERRCDHGHAAVALWRRTARSWRSCRGLALPGHAVAVTGYNFAGGAPVSICVGRRRARCWRKVQPRAWACCPPD